MKKYALVCLVTLFILTSCQSLLQPQEPMQPKPPAEPVVVELPRLEIFPGDYAIIFLKNSLAEDIVSISSPLFPKNPEFFAYHSGKLAFVSVSYRTKPGEYPLKVTVSRANFPAWEKDAQLTVKPKEFKVQRLRVTAKQAAQRSPELWEKDAVLIDQAKASSNPEPLWQEEFIQPVHGRISTEYGQIRYINKVESGRHAGIDIAAPRGTEVQAANAGIITLATRLNVTGNTIIIDHGANLFSAYAHLDQIGVLPGQLVAKGEVVGLVGSTGFSTGPHLHWTISTGSDFINPWLLVERDPLSYLQSD